MVLVLSDALGKRSQCVLLALTQSWMNGWKPFAGCTLSLFPSICLFPCRFNKDRWVSPVLVCERCRSAGESRTAAGEWSLRQSALSPLLKPELHILGFIKDRPCGVHSADGRAHTRVISAEKGLNSNFPVPQHFWPWMPKGKAPFFHRCSGLSFGFEIPSQI